MNKFIVLAFLVTIIAVVSAGIAREQRALPDFSNLDAKAVDLTKQGWDFFLDLAKAGEETAVEVASALKDTAQKLLGPAKPAAA